MLLSISMLKEKYKQYKDIYGKIKRDVDNGLLFPVVKGLYETNKDIYGLLLTAYINNPSYVSFEYALGLHGMIPERVVNYTNASFNKRKIKKYYNAFGYYTYRDIPKSAYPHYIKTYVEDSYTYFLATKEKALCDMLYILPPVRSLKALKELIFDDMRIYEDEFDNLNFSDLLFLSEKYNSTNIKLLKRLIEKEYI